MRSLEEVQDTKILSFLNELIKNDHLHVFDQDNKSFKSIKSVCINGDTFQLNADRWEGESND